ncbi:uncharacterized protein METZ01_LOCUS178514, partial [marine metagenome]
VVGDVSPTTRTTIGGFAADGKSLMKRITYTKPWITELEVAYATDAAQNGWGEHCYDYIHRFEAEFSAHIGTEFAIATSSCTGALHLGMASLGIGRGDEVIFADTNYIAAIAPVVHLGAMPIFLDVHADTWCLDITKVEASISTRTRAIVATHLYGNLVDMDALCELAAHHGIPVIEDAAEGLGSTYHGMKAGSIGTCGAFSFHGTKTLTTGEGGMLVTNDATLFERALTLSNHGRNPHQTGSFVAELIGYKYKMSNIQAALGCAQLSRVDDLVLRKQEILDRYRDRLAVVDGVTMNPLQAGCVSGAWMPTVRVDAPGRSPAQELASAFRDNGVDSRPFFTPISSFDMFENQDNPVAYKLAEQSINLPSAFDISAAEQDRVCSLVEQVVLASR